VFYASHTTSLWDDISSPSPSRTIQSRRFLVIITHPDQLSHTGGKILRAPATVRAPRKSPPMAMPVLISDAHETIRKSTGNGWNSKTNDSIYGLALAQVTKTTFVSWSYSATVTPRRCFASGPTDHRTPLFQTKVGSPLLNVHNIVGYSCIIDSQRQVKVLASYMRHYLSSVLI
jgi:hypothetical protein